MGRLPSKKAGAHRHEHLSANRSEKEKLTLEATAQGETAGSSGGRTR